MKAKNVLAALCWSRSRAGLHDRIADEPEFSRAKGAFGIPFKVEAIEGNEGAIVRMFFTAVQET